MYYDTRELRSASLLKKVRKTLNHQALPEKDFLYSCVSVVSYLIRSGNQISQEPTDNIRQIRLLRESGKDFGLSVPGELLTLTHHALRKPLQDCSTLEMIDLVNYIIDALIGLITGIDYRHCKIVSGFAGIIFDRARYDVIDVSPNIADLTMGVRSQGIKYSFLMSGQIQPEQKNLIRLKLDCNSINTRFAERFDEFPAPSHPQAFLIDAVSQTPGLSNPDKLINRMTSEEIYTQIPGRSKRPDFYIMTRTSKGANAKSFRHSWNPNNENIEAVVAFDSYHQGGIRKHLFIIVNNTDRLNDRTLYINLSDNPAIGSLDAIERSILAGSIYLSWRFNEPVLTGTPRKVASILNSQFRNGYRDVNGLCNAISRAATGSRYLFNVNRHVNFAGLTSLSEDHNSAELHSILDKNTSTCLYIIGNNGAGKSQLLGRLATEFIQRRKPAAGITLSQSNRFPKAQSEEYFTSFCLAQKTRQQHIDTVPGLFSRICCNPIKLETLLACLKRLDFTQDVYLGAKPHSKKRAMVDVESLVAMGPDATENEEALREIHQDSSTLVLVKKNDLNSYVFYSDLSSGEQNIITLLTLCIDNANAGTTLLLDEPEISLHVSWQLELPHILSLISEKLHVSIVTATHSPLLISNAPLLNTHCFRFEIGKLNYIAPEKRRSVETSLVSIFNTYSPLNKEVYERCARLVGQTINKRNSEAGVSTSELDDSLEQLKSLAELVTNSSVDHQGARYESDVELINKARLAIIAMRQEVADVPI